jgi:hypothetical protein
MSEITLTNKGGRPILYASMHGEHLRFEFEYYASNDSESDYEFIHTVFPADFKAIPEKFGLDPTVNILVTIRDIQDMGLGQALMDALAAEEIPNELFVWSN